ncbi:MAG: F0F1 ATP synthase subunit epsilon [Pseudomonadota bacterium]|jgi:F-type H+-transporting ATPase subunit epsilon
MADTLHFDLVSPERRLVSVDAREVGIPGADGDLTVMAGHAPVITTLRPGILRVVSDKGETDYTVTGGFAEVTGTTCTVLAERSHPVSEMNQSIFDEMMAELRARHDAAKSANLPGPTDEVVKLMADMVAMGSRIGLEPRA